MLYKNIQTEKTLDTEIIDLKKNSVLYVKPELFEEWDFEKNDELDILLITKGMTDKAWWICRDCHSEYDACIYGKISRHGCPYCAGKRVNHTNSLAATMPHIAKLWSAKNKKDFTPDTVTCGRATKAWWYCEVCDDDYPMSINKKTSGRGCSICAGYYTTEKNSFGGRYPELLEEWDYENNTKSPYEVSTGSGYRASFLCSNCNIGYTCTIDKKVSRASGCKVCSIHRSFGEKVFYELCVNAGLEFEIEKSFKWSNKKRYDFYFSEFECIVEIHGAQHYNKDFSMNEARTVEEEQLNDILKESLAKEHGVKSYIIIPSIDQDFNRLKKRIEESNVLDILKIDRQCLYDINKFALNNTTIKIWHGWNNNKTIKELIALTKFSESTIRKILRNGNSIGKCQYPRNK